MATRTYYWIFWPNSRIHLGKGEDKFIIEPGFSIKGVPQKLKEFALLDEQGTSILSRKDKDMIQKCPWCLAYYYEDPSVEEQSDDNVHQRDKNQKKARESLWRFAIIAALKYHFYFFASYRCKADRKLRDIWFWEPQKTPPTDPPEILRRETIFWKNSIKRNDLEVVKEIFLKVNQKLTLLGDTQQKLRNAIISAREAFQEGNIANQLLFFTISLENLFNDGRGDIGHKICARTACFVKDSYGDRIEVYNDMKKVYGTRSQISHGDINYNKPKQVESLKESHLLVRELVCRVLIKFLENKELWSVFDTDKNWKEFLRKLDLGGLNSISSL